MPHKRLYRKKHILTFFIIIIVALAIFSVSLYVQSTSETVYKGTFPCADCIGIKETLTLHGDHTYELQSLYINRGQPFTEKGTWEEIVKNNTLMYALHTDNQTTYYQKVNQQTVRMLDTFGNPINSPFNLELKRQ